MSVILGRLSGAFLLNCELFALTLLFALPLGLVVAFGSMSRCRLLSGAVKTFVWVIRGTPLMLHKQAFRNFDKIRKQFIIHIVGRDTLYTRGNRINV